MQKGDRVRINKVNRPQFRKSKRYRVGVVLGKVKDRDCVHVLWERRRSVEIVHVDLLELR